MKKIFLIKIFIKHEHAKHKTCLVCSSVIHEVYSYSTSKEIDLFWDRFWNSGFDYITVRDMYRNDLIKPFYSRCYIMNSSYRKQAEEFEKNWGKMVTVNDFHHFFLKYFYTENWDRELKENYIPLNLCLNDMVNSNTFDDYEVIFDIKYILPYIKQRVKEDFDIDIYFPTHYQKIFKKKDR